ncbi:MAG: LPS export ABC transporter permease LptF [Legionellaceae bacterium]|nr:LPS export ABC transporter permease LptF [Legionellaceae bacterium]
MLIFRYLAKEVFITLIALTSILLLIFMSNQVVIYLNRAATGIIPGMLVMKLMVLELPNLLSLLLPLGFYFALILAYGRLYADSEMTVMRACGFGTGKLLLYSLIMALFVAIFTAGMIWTNPSIAYKRAKLLQTSGVKTMIKTIVPGRFRAISGGRDVFYVESMNPKHTKAENIFVARSMLVQGKQQWDIIWADKASIESIKNTDTDYLILHQGKKYQGVPGQANYQVAKFKSYRSRLPNPNVVVKNDIRTVPLSKLWPLNNPDLKKAAELQWRISIPLMIFALTLVGVPLSRVNPRGGKYAKILPAIIICVIYANFMFIARDWIIAGKVPLWIGMWWLHLLVAFLGLGLIWRNRGV